VSDLALARGAAPPRTHLRGHAPRLGATFAACATLAACAASTPPPPAAPTAVETATRSAEPMTATKPTPTRASDHVDVYHGVSVPDPYRWLEDPDSDETRAWVTAQNAHTFAWLGGVKGRDALHARLTELWNYERFSPPWKRSGRYFYFRNDGLQNQSVLYVADGKDAPARVLLDPNTLSKEGVVALSSLDVSRDGRWLVYGLSEGGSDWVSFRVKNVDTGEDLPDVVRWSKFSGAAIVHGKKGEPLGFFYGRYPEPKAGDALEEANYFHKIYFHALHTEQSADVLVHEDLEHKDWGFSPTVTDDDRYLVLHVWKGTDRRNRVYVRRLGPAGHDPKAKLVKLLDGFDAKYRFVGNVKDTFYVHTDLDAPKGRVVAIDLARPDKARWRTVVAEGEHPIEDVSHVGGGLVVERLVSAVSELRFHTLDGKSERPLVLPGVGSVGGVSGEPDDPEVFFAFSSFTTPASVLRADVRTGAVEPFRTPALRFSPDAFVTTQVRYRSKDGTEIPMFVVHKKDLPRTGDAPTLLYGYGGFNVSLPPSFSAGLIALLERGFVYAQPSLRGGAELGEAWHQAGMLDKKQNVFDDFAAAAEWLVAERYTASPRLAIQGGSNGGLLVGASITQRPELFGAAIAQVGVLDMLRFHKFTIGHAWVSEYGSSDDAAQFQTLKAYSPLHNLKPGARYPATLITTADHDDRVVPAHSFKFAAALQAAQGGDAPALIRVDVKAGHGAGKPTSKLIDETADRWAFLLRALGVDR
jgi:prolyl oligopeptidase